MVRALNTPTDPELANLALRLALEWGENWLEPIQERLAQIRPDLTPRELDGCQAHAKRVFERALRVGREALKRDGLEGSAAADEARHALLEAFPWLDEANLSRLVSQSLYYALK
ncbi:MAG: hypothetical protein AB7K71_04555 [Polyangiaceae bacterium]